MAIKPIDDRILIKPTDAKTRTQAGIYLPESAAEKPMTGKVVAVGPGKVNDDGTRTAPAVSKGDTVVYGKYAGSEVEIDGVEHKIVKESELLAVIEN